MLMRLPECRKKFGGAYQVEKLVREGGLYRLETGVYSDTPDHSELEVLLFKYPHAVVTMQSAYCAYDLSDAVPDLNYLATDRDAHKIDDPRVVQCFVPNGTVELGVVERKLANETISRIYDRERLLIETIRYKTKLPYDLYREVIGSFRAIASELYTAKMCDYLEAFPRKNAILRTIESEVL